MQLKNLFSNVKLVNEEETKAFINSHKTDSYQLVDVRQPEEYSQSHLPGAILIPLNELILGKGNLDPQKPTFVYCRSGNRSRTAARWLVNQGFPEVFDIGENIMSWLGLKISGSYDFNLNLINEDVDFPDAWTIAYAMEEGLQRFYLDLEKLEPREKYKKLFLRLAGFEDHHKERLIKGFKLDNISQEDVEKFLEENKGIIEGGSSNEMDPDSILFEMEDLTDIFALSIAIETHSFDLYVKFAEKATNPDSKNLFLELADEEKNHLNLLSKEMDKYLSQQD